MKISKDAQAVVYRKKGDIVEFLVLRRYDKDKDEVHYRLIKGGVKSSEEIDKAVIREVGEEAGLKNLSLGEIVCDYSYQAGEVQHDVTVFLVENTEIEDIQTDSSEEGGFTIKGAEWFDGVEAIEKLNFSQEKDALQKALDLF